MEYAKTILVRHWGGLGNQMYQYSFARQLSILNNNAQIMADLGFFANYYWPYQLDIFNVKNTVATNELIFKFDNGNLPKFVGKVLEKIPWIKVKDFIRRPFSYVYNEKSMNYDNEALNIRKDVYLKGYWCSYKYFNNIRDVLLEDFTLKSQMNDANKKIAEKILSAENSVSLHIRRGDYVKLADCKAFFRSLYEDGFYDRALNEVNKRFENIEFFLFSDDPDWVKENLKLKNKSTVVDINSGDSSYWDMKLMSLCKHNIIANSTFSWWAAWLNQNPDKLVLAPKYWINSDTFKLEDTIPPEWIAL